MNDKCFACDRPLKNTKILVDTKDDQFVYVGPDCYKKILKAGDKGFQPKGTSPKLYPIKK